MRLNRTSMWKVMTIWISWELPLLNFLRLNTCAPESDNCVKRYDHWNFLRASVVQLRAPRYVTNLNRTTMWIVMSIWISRELPLFNFERLAILFSWIEHPSEKLWPFELLESFRCSISRASVWKVMTIWISRELPLFNFLCLEILFAWIEYPSEKLWPFGFLESFHFFNFGCRNILYPRIVHTCENLLPFEFLESFCCWI